MFKHLIFCLPPLTEWWTLPLCALQGFGISWALLLYIKYEGGSVQMKDELLAYSASANSAPISLLLPEGKCDGPVVRGRRFGSCPGEIPPARNQVQSSLPEKRICVGLYRWAPQASDGFEEMLGFFLNIDVSSPSPPSGQEYNKALSFKCPPTPSSVGLRPL